jgi:hypothetical protein
MPSRAKSPMPGCAPKRGAAPRACIEVFTKAANCGKLAQLVESAAKEPSMTYEAILKYPAVFMAGLLAALVLTPLWRRIAPRLGFLDRPGERKIHRQIVPSGGGLAVFIGFHAACAVVFLVPWKPFAGQLSIDWWFRFLPLSAGVVALGLLDDRFDLKPLIKLAGQSCWPPPPTPSASGCKTSWEWPCPAGWTTWPRLCGLSR